MWKGDLVSGTGIVSPGEAPSFASLRKAESVAPCHQTLFMKGLLTLWGTRRLPSHWAPLIEEATVTATEAQAFRAPLTTELSHVCAGETQKSHQAGCSNPGPGMKERERRTEADGWLREQRAVLPVVIRCYYQCGKQTRILEPKTLPSGIRSRRRTPSEHFEKYTLRQD